MALLSTRLEVATSSLDTAATRMKQPLLGRCRSSSRNKTFVALCVPAANSSPSLPLQPDPLLINDDLRPVTADQRILSAWDMTFLWLGLVVSVPNYYLAGSLVELGMSWWQGIGTVVAANAITYVMLVLNGHPGTKYGISFPVLSRASFGVFGANIPTLLRSLVGCGWFSIETWIGGEAIFQLLNVLVGQGRLAALASNMPLLGTSVPELACFLGFWLLQLVIIYNGMQCIKELDKYSAPVLVLLTAALLCWAYSSAGGWGPMLASGSAFAPGGSKEGQFLKAFFPALTANIGCWATLSLNIPDFTRYTPSQADQVLGQASLPLFMAAFSFVGLAVTSATVVIYGQPLSNPIQVLARIGGVLPSFLSLVGIILATLTTNIAANVVATANSLVNLSPQHFTYKTGGTVAAFISLCFVPWKLLQDSQGFVYAWLVGYSALLGPVLGIILFDYYIVRGRNLDVESLYSTSHTGSYWYLRGVNPAAVLALVAGLLPSVPGFLGAVGVVGQLPAAFIAAYDAAWFVGVLVAGFVYWITTKLLRQG